MSSDKPAGAVGGVAVVLGVCCGLHALLLVFGGITFVGFRLHSLMLAFAGLIVLILAVVWFRHRRCPVPDRDRTEGDGDARRSRTG